MADKTLEHYGVKGMRWGVRKQSNSKDSGASTVKPKLKRGAVIALKVAGAAALVGLIDTYGEFSYKAGQFDQQSAHRIKSDTWLLNELKNDKSIFESNATIDKYEEARKITGVGDPYYSLLDKAKGKS